MSAISSIGSSYSQALLAQQTQQVDPDHDGDKHNGFSSQAFKTRFESAAQAAGADPTKLDSIYAQIQQAIQDASQNSSGTDPRAAVQQAVNGVLKSNGIDPAKFQSALRASGSGGAHKGRHHHGANGQAANSAQQQPADSTSTLANLASGTKIDATA